MAPKLWPVSWATTCHSVRPDVETAVPDTVSLCWLLEAPWLHLESQCENERINLNYSQCPKPSNTNFGASWTTTHQMPQSCTVIPLLTSPLWKKWETFFQCNISAADIPRDSRIRGWRTAIEFFLFESLLTRHQISYPWSWTARCRIPKLILKVFCKDFRYNQIERDQNKPCIMYLPY